MVYASRAFLGHILIPSQHANADGLSRQCGQCLRPDCLVGPPDLVGVNTSSTSDLAEQPFAASALGDSMDTDLLPVLSGESWLAAIHLYKATGDLPPPDSDPDLIASSLTEKTLTIVRDWVRAGTPPVWSDCAGLSPELHSPRTSGDSATTHATAGQASGVHAALS